MKSIPVEEAVGSILCQDITRIVPDEFKGRAFRKGHLITAEDVPELLKLGKEHLYVWESKPGEIHEEEAALRIARATVGPNISYSETYEGKSTFKATARGLFSVNVDLVDRINDIEYVTLATLPDNYPVEEGRQLAGTRVIPLMIEEEKLFQVEALCREFGPAVQVKPYQPLKVGIVTTGSEIFKGRIKDCFGPVIRKKVAAFGGEVLEQIFCPDEMDAIVAAVDKLRTMGAELILLTGGMSVDPDDLTPAAIRATGAEVVTYGVPVQPGNMFMLAYLEGTVLMGVPGCAMYFRTTILDVVLPRIFAGDRVTRPELVRLGVGGFCAGCKECRYPDCQFC